MTHSLSLEALEDRTAPTANGYVVPIDPVPIHDSGATYVRALYSHVLGREASASELNYWASVVGRFGTAAVASGILNSTESQNRTVNDLYVKLLGRPADDAGLRYWRGVLSGGGLEAVTAGILASPESQSLQVDSPVAADYQQLLGRAPGTAELSYWNGVESRQGARGLAWGILASAEYRADFTQALFALDLHRQGNTSELSHFANNHALTLLQIEATVLTSLEYLADNAA